MSYRLEKRLEIVETTFKKYSERRKKNIKKSLIRPLYQEFLKSLFIIIIMILDVFLILEIIILLSFPINLISIIIITVILYIEKKIYNKYWGQTGKWSINKYKKNKL
jgi:hypothetical protein